MTKEFEPACRRMEWLDPFYKQVWEKAFAKAIPISGTFELTPRCNFKCKMCYVHLEDREISCYGRELSAKEWISIAEAAKKAGTTWLCITGGEPFLHPEFETIWKELSEMGFFLTLQTNASLISKWEKLLQKYPPRQVKITLYGTNNTIYENVCGIKNGFSHVNDGIHILMSLGIPVVLVSTIIRQNEDNAQDMAFYAYRHQLPWTLTSGIRKSIRNNGVDVSSLCLAEKREEHLRKEIKRRWIEKDFLDPTRNPCSYCKDFRLGYWIHWDGKMRFCSFLNEPDISVKQVGFEEAWKQLVLFEEKLLWPKECMSCSANKVCFKCAASLATESGSVKKVSEAYCDKIRSLYEQIKREESKDEL